MTIDEFFDRLKETPRTWKICFDDSVRRTDVRESICPCPVLSVLTPVVDVPCERLLEDCGMQMEDMDKLMEAIDGVIGHDPAIRARLLEACGLAPAGSGPREEG